MSYITDKVQRFADATILEWDTLEDRYSMHKQFYASLCSELSELKSATMQGTHDIMNGGSFIKKEGNVLTYLMSTCRRERTRLKKREQFTPLFARQYKPNEKP